MMAALQKEDKMRIKAATRKITERACKRRRKLRADKKSKKEEPVTYQAGIFGLSNQPEDINTVKRKGSRMIKRKIRTKLVSNSKKKMRNDDYTIDMTITAAITDTVTMEPETNVPSPQTVEVTFVDESQMIMFYLVVILAFLISLVH